MLASTIEELLKMPDAEILRVGRYVVMVAREYKRLTGEEPSACDCQTKNYLRVIRLKHSKDAIL